MKPPEQAGGCRGHMVLGSSLEAGPGVEARDLQEPAGTEQGGRQAPSDTLSRGCVAPRALVPFLQKHSKASGILFSFFFLLWVAKESYFKVRNTCQHPSTAPRADDANMTRSEVRLQMRPLQNLSQKTGGLKKEMKCSEKKKKTKKGENNQQTAS